MDTNRSVTLIGVFPKMPNLNRISLRDHVMIYSKAQREQKWTKELCREDTRLLSLNQIWFKSVANLQSQRFTAPILISYKDSEYTTVQIQ